MSDVDTLITAIQRTWPRKPGKKAQRYIGKFWDRTRYETKITAKVEGNHGIYTVSIIAEDPIKAVCSCYIGAHGGCHHCTALGCTFLHEPGTFTVIELLVLQDVASLDDLKRYLHSVTLDELIQRLRANGITQKAFAESVGITVQKLGAIKRSEDRNRYFHELGALKLACIWVLQNLTNNK
jgi:uncharacterized Zn finger protein